jgi:glycosyltransferase involved in cell wall biosynthesis
VSDRRPRVAVWRDTFAPYSETFIWDELRHHVRWRATVFAWKRLNADRFPWDDTVSLDDPPVLGGLAQAVYRATSLSPRFLRALGRGGYSLVHAHFGTAGVRALPYAIARRLPLVTMFHGGDVSVLVGADRLRPMHWAKAAAAPLLFRRAQLILAASVDLRDRLEEGGCPAEKIRVFRLGIDLSQFERARVEDGSMHVVMVGRLVEKKGFDDGLRALAEARSHVPRLRVTVVGDGPLGERLRALAGELGLAEHVRFAGAQPHAAVKAIMSDADVILAPSAVTPSGDRDSGIIVVKEAAASRVPCVGTLHGGLPEIVEDGTGGFLVPEHDVAALADRIRRLAVDPALRERMGAAARVKMEREYDIRHRVAELEDLYDEVVARWRARRRGQDLQ